MSHHDTTQTGGVPCFDCESVMESEEGNGRAVCPDCDATLTPCPECGSVVSIPGRHRIARGYCTACGGVRIRPNNDTDEAKCLDCGNLMESEEFPGGRIVCGGCDSMILILRDEEADIE